MKLETLCYIRNNGKTLMIQHNREPGQFFYGIWNGLGGKVNEGETPLESVVREVYEESGLKIRNPSLRGIMIHQGLFGDNHQVFVYVADEFEGNLKKNGEGRLKWSEDPLAEKIWKTDRIWYPCVDLGKFFVAEFVYNPENGIVSQEIKTY